jgi:hypothetical protein
MDAARHQHQPKTGVYNEHIFIRPRIRNIRRFTGSRHNSPGTNRRFFARGIRYIMKNKPEFRGKVHLIYARENCRLHLVGFGYGYYIAKATESSPVVFSVNCEEWKHGENDYRYINKETTISRLA